MKTIGIDIGTTNTKVILYNILTATVVQKVSAPTPIVENDWGRVRYSEDIVSLVKKLIMELGEKVDVSDVVGLSVSCVGEEIVLIDETGHSLAPIIPWFDERSWPEREQFFSTFGIGLFRGITPGPWYVLYKLLWFKRHHPEILKRTSIFTDIGSFVLGQFSSEYKMDWSHASRTGVFDVLQKDWNAEIVAASGLPREMFPELVPSGSKLGIVTETVAKELGLPSNVVICAGGHDHFCAAFAGGVRNAGDVLVSAGTSEACFVLMNHPIPNLKSRFPAEQGCFVDGLLYYIMISIPSGHLFQQWKELLYKNSDDEEIYQEMSITPIGCEGNQFIMSDDLCTWTLTGSNRFFERGTVMRAVQEGIAAVSRDVVNELFSLSDNEGKLYVTGKPTSHLFWRNLRSEAYKRELHVIHEVESASLGAALMAKQVCEV
ncbi:FGGY-family carbohydrate kinase [Alicyclobacillus fastidiosus]|uniref:FGGY-family carbohydrate kinase n=1 Tax=Alicyclobacillus fastidiosus TaxID=392011 RepID=A0ABY6ZDT4_9BACL|nr:FGGY-family carbohydrate kinase [Alicyclobacillus fastidiosus]WAH40672.1 FGGY-family carbohydrate kinase [Alicyclobacillus fastidiosus]GMA62134.1 xylulokinase [Alicyclobacillus fastidiosus]